MMTSHPLPPAYDESAHLPVYDDVVIANRLQQLEKRLQKHITDVLKHNDVAVSEKAQKMVDNILLIYEKRFDDLGGEVRQKMDAFKDWSTHLGTGEQTLIEMDKKIAKIHDKVTELDAFHAVIKRHEEREKKIHSDLLSDVIDLHKRIKALEEREERSHDVLIDEGVMRHIEKMVETRIGRAGEESGVNIDIDELFDDSKLTPEDIEEIKKIMSDYTFNFKKYEAKTLTSHPPTILIYNLFKFLTKNKENVFLVINTSAKRDDRDKPLVTCPSFIFTNKNIYFIRENKSVITRINNHTQWFEKKDNWQERSIIDSWTSLKEISDIYVKMHINDTFEVCAIYTFKEPLNFAIMKYMRYAFLQKFDQGCNIVIDQEKRVFRENCSIWGIVDYLPLHDTRYWQHNEYEQIIRLIPGSFQNDEWIALGGFFGMYFNKKTLKISYGSPSIIFDD
jgi:flagellar motility protein MotE (MotC chaperone)